MSTTSEPQQRSEKPPLDPAAIKLIDALARAQAKEDHNREATAGNSAAP